MKSRTTSSIRAPGQRSISSTFLFRPLPKCSSNCRKDSDAPSTSSKSNGGGRPHLSLSAFLDRKLHSAAVLPINKVENSIGSISRADESRREGKRPAIEDSVFKLFNDKQGGRVSSTHVKELVGRSEVDEKKHCKNHVVIVGDDPKPKRKANAEFAHRSKKPRAHYNHYKNGSGWWESEREGIDDDEVGSKESWEGLASTTLGGLEWH